MQVKTELTSSGYQLWIDGPVWRSERCALAFPEVVWRSFPARKALVRELAYVQTLAPPLILNHPTVWYQTPAPQFFDLYNDCFEAAIPNLTDPVAAESATEILARFRKTGRHFAADGRPGAISSPGNWDQRRVVLPFSFGKDCLTSLATLCRLGYEVIPVCLDDRVVPRGTAIRAKLQQALAERLGIDCRPVRNEVQLLSDYQVLQRPMTHLHRVHIYFVHLLAMLPFCYHYRAPVIALNNEYCLSLAQMHREGFLLPHKVMQRPPITRKLRRLVEQITGGDVTVVNLIGGLGDFTINRLLHDTFADFGDFRVSCHMEVSAYERWCHGCPRCAQAYLFARATGRDPFKMGFEESLFTRDKQDCFYLFKKDRHPRDVWARYHEQSEMLAFSMALQRGARGALADHFRQVVGPVPAKTQRQLARAMFRVHGGPGKHPAEKAAHALYRRQVKQFRTEVSF